LVRTIEKSLFALRRRRLESDVVENFYNDRSRHNGGSDLDLVVTAGPVQIEEAGANILVQS
jgi:hypothetical protein